MYRLAPTIAPCGKAPETAPAAGNLYPLMYPFCWLAFESLDLLSLRWLVQTTPAHFNRAKPLIFLENFRGFSFSPGKQR